MPTEGEYVDRKLLLGKPSQFVPDITIGDLPGMASDDDEQLTDGTVQVTVRSPPIDPADANKAARSSGVVMALGNVVAYGCGGGAVEPVKRTKTAGDEDQQLADRRDVDIFLASAFATQDKPVATPQEVFRHVEFDRFKNGWGAVNVTRAPISLGPLPPPVTTIRHHDNDNLRATTRDRSVTMVPVPVVLQSDGSVMWVEVPHVFFRWRDKRPGNSKFTWFKSFGDWRSMDAKTGRYSSGSRRVANPDSPTGYAYITGVLPSGAIQASEIAHFSTYYTGVAPYGVSAWHSEFDAVAASDEQGKLLLAYMKSGLFSIILAAASRPFDKVIVDDATKTINRLGRGRDGLAALVTLSLTPTTSQQMAMPGAGNNDAASSQGRIILHELSTKLPTEIINGSLEGALVDRLAQAERIPTLLIGKAGTYSSATASAAWMSASKLRFQPAHADHDALMNAALASRGVVSWGVETTSPTWKEDPSITAIGQTAGQYGGMTINTALAMMAGATGDDFKPRTEWWGDLPMPIVAAILRDKDPYSAVVRVLGSNAPAKSDFDPPAELVAKVTRAFGVDRDQ